MGSVKTAIFGGNTRTSFKVLDVGGNDGSVAREKYPDAEIEVIDKIHGWDIMEHGLPEGPYSVILANHILEHLPDPDFFLEECKKIMCSSTILEIGMPNLNSWYNRIFFLLGYLPQSYEISYRKIYGRLIKDGTGPGGHIRVMNIPSTIALLKDHGFKIISVKGEASNRKGLIGLFDKFMTLLNINFSSAFRIQCII